MFYLDLSKISQICISNVPQMYIYYHSLQTVVDILVIRYVKIYLIVEDR